MKDHEMVATWALRSNEMGWPSRPMPASSHLRSGLLTGEVWNGIRTRIGRIGLGIRSELVRFDLVALPGRDGEDAARVNTCQLRRHSRLVKPDEQDENQARDVDNSVGKLPGSEATNCRLALRRRRCLRRLVRARALGALQTE